MIIVEFNMYLAWCTCKLLISVEKLQIINGGEAEEWNDSHR